VARVAVRRRFVTLCSSEGTNVTRVGAFGLGCHEMLADREVMGIAARQYGVVTARQLTTAGLGPNAIAHRVKTGRLTRLHRGVYLAAPSPAQLTFDMAAVLACGSTAVLSHHSAAALYGLLNWRGEIHVTVTRNARPRPGIRVHRAPLDPHDRTRRQGIPVTSPARTLVDLAPVLPSHRFDRAVEQAQVLRLVTAGALRRAPHQPSRRLRRPARATARAQAHEVGRREAAAPAGPRRATPARGQNSATPSSGVDAVA